MYSFFSVFTFLSNFSIALFMFVKSIFCLKKCGIEQAHIDGKIKWKKPISCHLFPLIVKKSKNSTTEYVNYEPREDHCKPGCALGKKLKVPVFEFLKEPLIRKFGKKFYEALAATATHLKTKK